ncbi:MAG: hypothetical protein ABJH45_13500 [Paracoccaceae bacterium]
MTKSSLQQQALGKHIQLLLLFSQGLAADRMQQILADEGLRPELPFSWQSGYTPAYNAFLIVWVTAILIFFVGIFAPIIGESEFFDTGWQIWQVGGAFSLMGFAISLFWSPH